MEEEVKVEEEVEEEEEEEEEERCCTGELTSRGVQGEGRKHLGQGGCVGSGGVRETTEDCELNLLKNLFSPHQAAR